MTAPAPEKPAGVSPIELFFDLVFVFVITRVTQLVEHAHGTMDFLRALLVLVPIWWMYAGYGTWARARPQYAQPMRSAYSGDVR
jgi:low temperature requirement protein LtrA